MQNYLLALMLTPFVVAVAFLLTLSMIFNPLFALTLCAGYWLFSLYVAE